jgi:hypothetical protein
MPPSLLCFVWFVLIIVIAGVIIWGLGAVPNLDADLKAWGRIILIVFTVIILILTLAGCLGFHMPWPRN